MRMPDDMADRAEAARIISLADVRRRRAPAPDDDPPPPIATAARPLVWEKRVNAIGRGLADARGAVAG